MDVRETIYEDFNEAKDYEGEIVEKIVKVLNEIKSSRYKSQNPITSVEVNTSTFLHFIGFERFNWNNDLLGESSQLHEDEGKQFF